MSDAAWFRLRRRPSGRSRSAAGAAPIATAPGELDACGSAHIAKLVQRFAERQQRGHGDPGGYDRLTALFKLNSRHRALTEAAGHKEDLLATKVLVGTADDVPETRVFETTGLGLDLTAVTPVTHMDAPTRGVIEVDPEGASAGDGEPIGVVRNYRAFRAGDTVRIWGTEGRRDGTWVKEVRHTQHLICEIEHKGVSYTFGLGFYAKSEEDFNVQRLVERMAGRAGRLSARLGSAVQRLSGPAHMFDTLPAAIYSPDYLFHDKLKRQAAHPDRKYLRLLTQGHLTPKHIAALRQNLDRIGVEDLSSLTVRPHIYVHPDAPAEGEPEELHNFVNPHTMTDLAQQALVEEALHAFYPAEQYGGVAAINGWKELAFSLRFAHEQSGRPFGSMGYFSPVQPWHVLSVGVDYNWSLQGATYCEFSPMLGPTTNCSKFLAELFDDLIRCKGSAVVVNPSFCHSRRTPPPCHQDGGV